VKLSVDGFALFLFPLQEKRLPCSKHAEGAASLPAAGKLRHYKDLPRQISSTKTKSRFLAPLGMTGRRLFQ